MTSRTWTSIRHADDGLVVMLDPDGMDTQALGFPDGLRLGGQVFADEEAACMFAERIESMLADAHTHASMDYMERDNGGMPPPRDGLFYCMLYQDVQAARRDGGAGAYLRLVLPGVDMQTLGFPHGISLGGEGTFANRADAVDLGQRVDAFMNECSALNARKLLGHAPGM